MTNRTLHFLAAIICLFSSITAFAQAPALGTAADFVLYTSVGAVTNTGITHLTGNVGTNSGSSTGFGNVDGSMHNHDGATLQCSTDLLAAYGQLNNTNAINLMAPLLGNGDTLTAGVDSIPANATLTLDLVLNAQGDSNAVFIFKIQGTLSTGTAAHVVLINGAKACNVFWKVEGLVSMASGTSMKGTVIANNAAITMGSGVTLEGRALSTAGAITANGILGYTPIGCNSPMLTGPAAPVLSAIQCFALFSGNGQVTNSGVTHVTGNIGTNSGLTTGFDSSYVIGTIYPIPTSTTAAAAANLHAIYSYLDTLHTDITLVYPAQFGHNLVLTPHVYLLDAATALTDTLYLNAEGNTDAVFVIKMNGALSTSTHSQVILMNGTQASNVYWKVEGAVNINDSSVFKGTLVANNGAIIMGTGTALQGRAFTTIGSLTTAAITAVLPIQPCFPLSIAQNATNTAAAIFYPNPWTTSLTVTVNDASAANTSELRIFNVLGQAIKTTTLSNKTTQLNLDVPAGVYYYKVISPNGKVQSGTLISK